MDFARNPHRAGDRAPKTALSPFLGISYDPARTNRVAVGVRMIRSDALFSLLLNSIYLMVLIAASPVLLWRAVRQGKYRAGWGEKLLGRLPESAPGKRVIWLHAVSVGEVLQLETIIPGLVNRAPDADILITCTTSTGLQVAQEKFGEHRTAYCPLDFSWAVSTALRRVRPDLIVLVELELWPNLIRQADHAGVRIALINGRMSESSYRGYRRVRRVMASLLQRFDAIGVQTSEYAERLTNLGAPVAVVTGSIKFDRAVCDRSRPATVALREAFRIQDDEIVLVAGSTQAPEEQMALDAWLQLRGDYPSLRLVIVPRHQERFDEVADLIRLRGAGLVRRSDQLGQPAAENADQPVILLDTLGELRDCWGLADLAFVGGSFGERGGQNMIEPAAFGATVLFGPKTFNFRDVVERLLNEDAAIVVPNTDAFAGCVRTCLADLAAARQVGQSAQRVVLAQTGASERTLSLLQPLLDERADVADRHGTRAA